MRQERTVQATIFEVFAGQEIGCELKAISQWPDRQRGLVAWWPAICAPTDCARPDAEACRQRLLRCALLIYVCVATDAWKRVAVATW
jgi:IS5 family transposase